MSDVFARLEELAALLNASSDQLNETIKRVEAKLALLRIGVEAWVKEPLEINRIYPDHPDSPVEKVFFGYAKFKGAWSLVIFYDVPGITEERNEHTMVPLLQSQRDFRVQALRQLPALLRELEESTQAHLKAIEEAQSVARFV